jgi:heparosan-N-sulfate-glucuronate 5-epimerase
MVSDVLIPGLVVSSKTPAPEAEPLWWWGIRALRREIFDFQFTYDVEAVDEPVDALLDYHIVSERLFFDAMRLDDTGVPIHWSRTFQSYNPMYVAWYGLTALQRWLRGRDPHGQQRFLRQVDWLVANARREESGLVTWPLTFDWLEGRCQLRAPWPSSMAQGLAISVLVRAHRLGARDGLLDLCLDGARLFELPLEQGGVVTREGGHALYEEYPGRPLPRILDGFLFSLLGLYDLAVATRSDRVHALLQDGLDGLEHELPFWDYRGLWSWYGSHGYLCPPHYHNLNTALLRVLGARTRRAALTECAARWDVSRRTRAERAAIFAAFIATKNRSRLRHHLRRWRSSRLTTDAAGAVA